MTSTQGTSPGDNDPLIQKYRRRAKVALTAAGQCLTEIGQQEHTGGEVATTLASRYIRYVYEAQMQQLLAARRLEQLGHDQGAWPRKDQSDLDMLRAVLNDADRGKYYSLKQYVSTIIIPALSTGNAELAARFQSMVTAIPDIGKPLA
jgi:hypothetical protein